LEKVVVSDRALDSIRFRKNGSCENTCENKFSPKIEGGVVMKPSVQTIQKIAKALEIKVDDLIQK